MLCEVRCNSCGSWLGSPLYIKGEVVFQVRCRKKQCRERKEDVKDVVFNNGSVMVLTVAR